MSNAAWSAQMFIWAGIALCISQAAMFSGLNLAIFSVSRLRLEVEAAGGSRDAMSLLELRRDANFTLATVLWGNVAINVLLTLLSNSVLAGVGAFLFSTVIITLFGEIAPQAYFARHALHITTRLKPVLGMYRVLLYPVAKPTALLLDWWVGPEAIAFFRERDFRALIMKHAENVAGEVGFLEATGALNFLDLDDIPVVQEGEPVDPCSVVTLPLGKDGRPVLPSFERSPQDPFLRQLNASGKKWVIITDMSGQPKMVMDAHHFLRHALFDTTDIRLESFWHRPVIVTDMRMRLGDVIGRMKVTPDHAEDDVIDNDLILVWGQQQRRIITGADLLGRLLRGIANRVR
ncbi:MAG: CNNM domain-containing protein [Gallionella sp.]